MKITIDQNVLAKALAFVSRIVVSRPSYPILSNLMIDASKSGTITFSATNLDITLSITAGAEVSAPGKITAPAKTLSDFVSFLPKGAIELSAEKDKLSISCPSHSASFATIPVEEFPELPEIETKQRAVVQIPGDKLKYIVDKVSFACARDLSRPIFSAVLVEKSANQLVFVGLDGHRLSKVNVPAKIEAKLGKLLIPAEALEEISRSVEDDDKVKIYDVKNGQHVLMKYGSIELAARQVEGVFPDYKAVLPKEEKTKLTLNSEEFLNVVKMARLFSSEESANRIEFEYKEGLLTVSSSESKVGESTNQIEAKGEGEDFTAAFNAQFLMDVLSRLSTENCEFSTFVPATDERLRGGVFREVGNEEFFHIVMPLFTG